MLRTIERLAKVAAATLLFTTSAEAAALPGFALVARTESFSFYSNKGNQKIDVKKVEDYLGSLKRTLGYDGPVRAEYFRYESEQQIAKQTGTYAVGVTFASLGQVHSTQSFHRHEIVHLVAGRMGNPGVFFHEGLAVALGNEGRWNDRCVDKIAKTLVGRLRFRALVDGFARVDPEAGYPLAGSFVKRLIAKHGAAKVAEFLRACRDERARDAAFARVFGVSLDDAGAAWIASL
jgi:hypothetical protein